MASTLVKLALTLEFSKSLLSVRFGIPTILTGRGQDIRLEYHRRKVEWFGRKDHSCVEHLITRRFLI